jgi:hypothetical protein
MGPLPRSEFQVMSDIATPVSIESYERERYENPILRIISCCDIFAPTWLCSYARYVEIELGSSADSNVRLLAYVLLREQEAKELPDWLWKSYLVPSTAGELSGFVVRALRDISDGVREDADRTNHQLKTALEGLDFLGCTEILCVSSSPHEACSIDSHEYGPTHMFIWRDADRFRFLEVHNES